MHYAKYQKGAVGSILLHSDRGIDSPDTHEHSNESIDKTRTHLNYDLKDRGGLTAYEYYKKRIDDIASETKERTGKSIRKDAVTLCSWAVTAPKDLPDEKLQDFFKASYEWFTERYGADNIVTAAVHMDETTPHMHLQFTPIIEKDGVRKLCAKDMETRKTLSTAHQKLQKHLEQALGCEVNILNGATENGSKSIERLKLEQLQSESTQVRGETEQLRSENERLREENTSLEKKAIEYQTPPKKRPLESKKDYEVRVAVEQKQIALAARETRLSQRESDFNAEVEQVAKHYVYTEGVKAVKEAQERTKQAQAETIRVKQQAQQDAIGFQRRISQLEQENKKLKERTSGLESYVEEQHWELSGGMEALTVQEILPELYEEEKKLKSRRDYDLEL